MAFGEITSRAVGKASRLPDDDPEHGVFYLLLGTYTIDADKLYVASEELGAQSFELCGGVEPLWGPA